MSASPGQTHVQIVSNGTPLGVHSCGTRRLSRAFEAPANGMCVETIEANTPSFAVLSLI